MEFLRRNVLKLSGETVVVISMKVRKNSKMIITMNFIVDSHLNKYKVININKYKIDNINNVH